MQMRQRKVGKIFLYLFLFFMVFITLVPLLYTVSASFKTNLEILAGGSGLIPKEPTLENYKIAWTMGSASSMGSKATFADYTVNTLRLATVTTVGTVFLTSMCAYAFSRGDFPGRKALYWTFLATMFIAAGSVTLFPIVQLMAGLKMSNLWGVSIVQICTSGASNLFLTMGYMKTISKEIDEAAKIDGCSFFGIYWRVILPLTKPILATVALMSFRFAWNDYLMPMVMTLGKPANYPLVVGIVQLKSFGGEGAAQYNLMMAGTMFAILPIVILYLCMNKYFVAGITAGAVKG